ncbi:hypothetical protein LX36DRAFT_233848 [Colletotrichum falcatum]|nr:hypothetical protein LX36DRAFT_233848 [Colletotrichum falcatum]
MGSAGASRPVATALETVRFLGNWRGRTERIVGTMTEERCTGVPTARSLWEMTRTWLIGCLEISFLRAQYHSEPREAEEKRAGMLVTEGKNRNCREAGPGPDPVCWRSLARANGRGIPASTWVGRYEAAGGRYLAVSTSRALASLPDTFFSLTKAPVL